LIFERKKREKKEKIKRKRKITVVFKYFHESAKKVARKMLEKQ